jgi:hypothetical protein
MGGINFVGVVYDRPQFFMAFEEVQDAKQTH